MRTYPSNSPQAAARIVALAMLADWRVCNAELEKLIEQGVYRQLGLQHEELAAVVHACCDDLLTGAQMTWADACRIDPVSLLGLMAEVDDPALRLKVLHLCISVAEADGDVAHRESAVLVAAAKHWGLQRSLLPRSAMQQRNDDAHRAVM